jgi:hypothetical protein
MSDMSTESAPAARSSGGGGTMSAFKRKIGPLPMWAWMAIGLGIALALSIWQKNKKASSSQTAASADTTTAASQIPQFVNQTYVQNTPPQTTTPTGGGTGTVTTPPPTQAAPRPTQITASGEDNGDINRIAQSYGLTESELVAANPGLKTMMVTINGKKVKLYGSGAPVPKGTVIKIPPVPAK